MPRSPLAPVMAHRHLGRDLRPPRRTGRGSPLDADLVNTAATRRESGAPPGRAHRRGQRHIASRQLGKGASPRCGTTAQGRQAQGAGRDGLAGARHRHRRRRPDPIQLGSPRGIATFLQRVGRSGHGVDALPKGRLFPLTRDDLVESVALLDAVQPRRTRCDPFAGAGARCPLTADCRRGRGARVGRRCAMYATVHARVAVSGISRARNLISCSCRCSRTVTRLVAGGRRPIFIWMPSTDWCAAGRRGARLMALTNGGAIPDQFDYDVVMLPEEISIGSLNEDFAFESLPGDIFQLGNHVVPRAEGRSGQDVRSRMRKVSRRTSRSGSARHRAAPMSFHSRYRGCAASSIRR